MSGSEKYRLDEQVGYLLRQASQRHAALFQSCIPHRLTPTQFAALIRLAETGPCSQNQLGRVTSMDVATIKGVVQRLRAKGFVSLSADPGDRRRTLVALTEKAESIVSELHDAGHAITTKTLDPITAVEARQFLRLLEGLT